MTIVTVFPRGCAALLLALPLVACSTPATQTPSDGSDGGTADAGGIDAGATDAGTPDGGDAPDGGDVTDGGSDGGMPIPYVPGDSLDWHIDINNGLCHIFDDGLGGSYTVGVGYSSELHERFPDRTPFELQHTYNGARVRTDVVSVATSGLFLMGRWTYDFNTTGMSTVTFGWDFRKGFFLLPDGSSAEVPPPLDLMNSRLDAKTSQNSAQGFTVTVTGAVEEDVMALGETQHSRRYDIAWKSDDGKDTGIDVYWVTPKVGIVKMQIAGMPSPVTLKEVKLGANVPGCGYFTSSDLHDP